MGSHPICHPSPARKMECSFVDYIQLLMIGWAGWWTQTPSATLSPAKKMKCSFLDYVQLLIISLAGRWAHTPSATPLQPGKWNAHFWITFNFWWSALGWLMDSNPICNTPLQPEIMKCLFLDYVQLLLIGQAGQWTQTPCSTPLQPEKWNAHFWIMFNFWWSAGLVWWTWTPSTTLLQPRNIEMLIFGLRSTSDNWPGWLMDLNPIHHPSPAKKMKGLHFGIMLNFWWSAWAGRWTRTPSTMPLQPEKLKCSSLDYIQLLMIGWAGRWTRTPSATPLQPANMEMLIFGLHSTSDDRPLLVDGLKLYATHLLQPK